MNKFYITTAIPYVNAAPHIGHALEFVQADVIARFHRLLGEDVTLLSGGDENAVKNVQAAEKAGQPVQAFIDDNTEKFLAMSKALSVQFDVFQKGSDHVHHFPSSQKLWHLCLANGDIYKKSYEGLYCVGCETFYTPDELNALGECDEHPGKKLETIKEENYFFRLSAYQQQLIDLLSSDTILITPEHRKKEMLSFLSQPLQDISISRSNARARDWGVPVPDDPTQRMYVWFDALNIYQSGIGFGWDESAYGKWWPADLHVIGKGILRFHAIYWPAFLLSAHLPIPKGIFVHDYFTVNGQKMSKTLGNVIDPMTLIETYGADGLRYYFLSKFSPFHDGDFSIEKFTQVYNADLANGLGNLVSRVAKLAEKYAVTLPSTPPHESLYQTVFPVSHTFLFHSALEEIWKHITLVDQSIEEHKPWSLSADAARPLLIEWIASIKEIAFALRPFLPTTADHILTQFSGPTVVAQAPLFMRIK